jgi:hypothetical protein
VDAKKRTLLFFALTMTSSAAQVEGPTYLCGFGQTVVYLSTQSLEAKLIKEMGAVSLASTKGNKGQLDMVLARMVRVSRI